MKTVVCVFAHPDDEALGPSGTIAQLAKSHNIYILCATKGEGQKTTGAEKKELGEIRKNELLESARILGIKKVFFLNFKDGHLCNSIYHSLAKKVQDKVEKLKPEILITFEPRGISGHTDHILVSNVTSFVFEKVKSVSSIYYYCIDEKERNTMKDYFIYFPPGYKQSEIDKVVDVSDVWEQKEHAMRAHKTQEKDVERILDRYKTLPKEEYFLVKTQK